VGTYVSVKETAKLYSTGRASLSKHYRFLFLVCSKPRFATGKPDPVSMKSTRSAAFHFKVSTGWGTTVSKFGVPRLACRWVGEIMQIARLQFTAVMQFAHCLQFGRGRLL
jgi:hypothetical protein